MKTAGFAVHYDFDGKPTKAETHNEWLASLFSRDGSFMVPSSLAHVPAMKKHALEGFIDELEKIAASSGLGHVRSTAAMGAGVGGYLGLLSGANKKSKPESKEFSERHPVISRGLRGAALGGAVGAAGGAGMVHAVEPGRLTKEVGEKLRGPLTKARDAITLAKGDREAKRPDAARDKLVGDFLAKYKGAGVLGDFAEAAKGVLTKPIPGTPELGGIVSKVKSLAPQSAALPGRGPSKGFSQFVAQRAAAGH